VAGYSPRGAAARARHALPGGDAKPAVRQG
jgi:hypothetical protein